MQATGKLAHFGDRDGELRLVASISACRHRDAHVGLEPHRERDQPLLAHRAGHARRAALRVSGLEDPLPRRTDLLGLGADLRRGRSFSSARRATDPTASTRPLSSRSMAGVHQRGDERPIVLEPGRRAVSGGVDVERLRRRRRRGRSRRRGERELEAWIAERPRQRVAEAPQRYATAQIERQLVQDPRASRTRRMPTRNSVGVRNDARSKSLYLVTRSLISLGPMDGVAR